MKRHISIFAFLLGAFAAGLALEARADQTVYGGYHYFADNYQSPRSLDRMALKGVKPASYTKENLALNATVEWEAYEPEGMRITKWGSFETSSLYYSTDAQKYSNYEWKESTSSEFTWKNVRDVKSAVIAVRFDYVKYNVSYDENGGSSKFDSVVNQPYNEDFTLAMAPTKTGYTFNKWNTSSNGESFEAGTSINGELLGLADCHIDGSNVTMTAQWATNTYSIGCELAGGSWPADYAPPARAIYDTVFSLPAPTRIGYDFIGWKVTSGLDTTTAKWGTGENPSTTVTADTLCVNGNKAVYFKNLNPTDNAAATLTAQWKAKTITVTLNNHGGTQSGVISTVEVTYGETYKDKAINPPTKEGWLFRGYEIDGVAYWDKDGQSTKDIWDIPTNCTAHAQWEERDYKLTYHANNGDETAQPVIQRIGFDQPTVLYDGAGFSNRGCTLLGWSEDPKATAPDRGCGLGATKSFTASVDFYAVWEKNYFIAYDGNGATNETPMAVQKFVFGKSGQSLNPNIYGKVGYTFDGWATNRAAALQLVKSYGDREIITKDLAKTVGETNSLYAVWQTNTYYVAFDPNGGTGEAMGVKTCTYDNPVMLYGKDEVTYSNGAYDFIGWSNDVEKIIYTDLTKPVSNLCVTANGTNTLYAVWKLSELSAAMHCDNLKWESYAYEGDEETYANKWRPKTNGEGVWQTGGDLINQQWLVAQVQTNGTLSFKWKPVGCEGQRYSLSYWITLDKDNYFDGAVDLKGADDEWHDCVISNVPSQYYVHFYVGSSNNRSYCQIDQMTWTPKGSEPKYVDVDSPVTGFSMADGKLVFAFNATNDEASAYHLLGTNDLVAPMPWPMVFEIGKKPFGPHSFKIPIKENEPKMFYRIRALK